MKLFPTTLSLTIELFLLWFHAFFFYFFTRGMCSQTEQLLG